jgi:hypothetical protein
MKTVLEVLNHSRFDALTAYVSAGRAVDPRGYAELANLVARVGAAASDHAAARGALKGRVDAATKAHAAAGAAVDAALAKLADAQAESAAARLALDDLEASAAKIDEAVNAILTPGEVGLLAQALTKVTAFEATLHAE